MWTQVSVNLPREQVPAAESMLQEMGAVSVTLRDSVDRPIPESVLEPAPGETPLWPEVVVTGLFAEATTDVSAISAGLISALSLPRAQQVEVEVLQDRDWQRAWLDRFRPMRFGKRLWIVPTGYEAPEPDAVNIRLDPGLAFGTGTHPTTAMCLQWLAARSQTGLSVLDYGCGSGVLGVAASLNGARHVVAVDNDPQALEATRANAQRNGVADLEVLSPEPAANRRPYDLVLANILAAPLIELAPELTRALKPQANIVLSGILADQAEPVKSAYRTAVTWQEMIEKDGWVCLAGTRMEDG